MGRVAASSRRHEFTHITARQLLVRFLDVEHGARWNYLGIVWRNTQDALPMVCKDLRPLISLFLFFFLGHLSLSATVANRFILFKPCVSLLSYPSQWPHMKSCAPFFFSKSTRFVFALSLPFNVTHFGYRYMVDAIMLGSGTFGK